MPVLAQHIINLKAVRNSFFPFISQIGISYGDSPLSRHDGDEQFAVKAGDRMPYFLMDGASIYDKLRNPRFHLIAFANDAQATRNEIRARDADVLDYQVLPLSPDVAKLFGMNEPFTVLLRPDNYIGFISPNTALDETELYLKRIVGFDQ
jgi:hypothetical protein